MSQPHDLGRFVDAQAGSYDQALAELRAGAKRSHWMWYIFPQLAGLGSSAMAQRYAITGLAEASAYLADPLLGERLSACTDAMLRHVGQSDAQTILGEIDAVKLRSSMTLFEAATNSTTVANETADRFAAVLDGFYDGVRDARTLSLLDR